MKTPLELLAPAGNAEIGKAAIDHGADAVYIGTPQFSARAQAGNSIEDIAELARHAHLYNAKVYVALNTILTDQEIYQALDLIQSLYRIGIDGIIIQDIGLLELDLPPIPLIASTQMHNATIEKVQFLESVNFKRIILARELAVDEIRTIREGTTVELEAFIHGALCVSYSGQCYMSQYAFGRSGNRGVCAQPCRHQYTLVDGSNKAVAVNRYLLSLKDMNRINVIGDLAGAGVTSFKIEGRYKEAEYVKNVTAAYRLAIDEFIVQNPQYCQASSGSCAFTFKPDPEKSFNRGFTDYFLYGRREKIAAFDSPKSIGQYIGRVDSLGRDWFLLNGHDLVNGDGLCFFTRAHELTGCKVDMVKGERVFPNTMTGIMVGADIYRNLDMAFLRILKGSIHCRKIAVEMIFKQEETGIRLIVRDEDGVHVDIWHEMAFVPARDPLRASSNIETQLMRSGDTPYRVTAVDIHPEQPGFLKLSLINDIRRKALDKLTRERIEQFRPEGKSIIPNNTPYPESDVDYRANVLNSKAVEFYKRHGVRVNQMALEIEADEPGSEISDRVVMTTKYCILYELGACLKSENKQNEKMLIEPLRISDRQHTYRLEFDCQACRMLIIGEGDLLF